MYSFKKFNSDGAEEEVERNIKYCPGVAIPTLPICTPLFFKPTHSRSYKDMTILKCSETYDDWSGCSSEKIRSQCAQSDHEDMINENFISDVTLLINIWKAQEERRWKESKRGRKYQQHLE